MKREDLPQLANDGILTHGSCVIVVEVEDSTSPNK